MGTDIHLAVEARINGVWVNQTPFTEEDGYLSNYPNGYYESRNYDVFAMLANVRNGYGFAGVDTGDGFVPLADPRGIPEDASPDVRRWAESGDHSRSYVTLAELMAYDWTRTTKKRGIVNSLREVARWKLDGSPDSWSGGIDGPGISIHPMTPKLVAWIESQFVHGFGWWTLYHHDNRDPNPKVTALEEALRKHLGTERPVYALEWEVPYYRSARELLGETMPKLWKLAADHGLSFEDVRLVFWFDS